MLRVRSLLVCLASCLVLLASLLPVAEAVSAGQGLILVSHLCFPECSMTKQHTVKPPMKSQSERTFTCPNQLTIEPKQIGEIPHWVASAMAPIIFFIAWFGFLYWCHLCAVRANPDDHPVLCHRC
eukprot:TRINITY_DN27_c0_g1_i3.p1 TRINITY_DN27_c0_g1~~TRINITY_DN27_c0_g1_i3.p1  ORF type:complete len:125 (+),score=2.92 TRINITY_DN27_c0_g1_i3:411-785(+)